MTDTKPDKAAETRDELAQAAREAEEARQADVVKAVEKANRDELPKLGGPLKSPGLGR